MNRHGGPGRGQGRKSVLSWWEMLQIGEMCDRLQTEPAKNIAMAKHEARPDIQRVRAAQARLAAIQPSLEDNLTEGERAAVLRKAKRIIKTDIRPVLGEYGARLIHLDQKPRRKTRAQICKLVADNCTVQMQRKITPRRVEACWKAFRQYQRQSQSYVPDVNNAKY